MVNYEIIREWIDNDEILYHFEELEDIDLTPQIVGILSQYFSNESITMGYMSHGVLCKIIGLSNSIIKKNQKMAFERLQHQKYKTFQTRGKINVKVIKTDNPYNKYFNRIIARCYRAIGDDVNAYNFFALAHEQGLDCEVELSAYESQFNEDNFEKVSELIEKARKIYKAEKAKRIHDFEERDDSIHAVEDYTNKIVDKYIYYLQGVIPKGAEYNLKDSVTDYVCNIVTGRRKINYSNYVYMLSSGIEGLLKDFYYKPYIVYLEEESSKNPEDEALKSAIKNLKDKIVKTQDLFNHHFSLGMFDKVSGKDFFLKWLQETYNENLTRPELDKFRKEIERVCVVWRNPVAHSEFMDEWKFKYLLNETVLKENCLLSQIIKNVGYVEHSENENELFNIEEFIIELQKFITLNKRSPKPFSEDAKEIKLAKEVIYARNMLVHGKLAKEDMKKLEPYYFTMGLERANWFDNFYEKLIQYKNKNLNFAGVSRDSEIGTTVIHIRKAYQGKGPARLTQEMIDKLDAINFPWESKKIDWFTPFYKKLIQYKNKNLDFAGVSRDSEIGTTVIHIRKAYQGKGPARLTQEMIDKLNAIGFPFESKVKKQEEDLSL